MARPAGLALLLLAGCSQPTIELLAPAGWQSAIIAVGAEVSAYEGPGPILLTHPEGADVEVVAVFYTEALPDLAILPGPQVGDRALPPSTLAPIARSVRKGSVSELEALRFDDLRVKRIRLARIDVETCAASQRCVEIDGPNRQCTTRCAAGGSVTPAPPELPRLLPCSGGWVEVEGECHPPAPPARLACPAGQAQHRAASTCAEIGRPCAGEWPVTPPAAMVRFVHPQGARGPGGEASFATLAEALAGAPSGAVIALSRGRHAGEVTLDGQILIGACARDTIVEMPTRAMHARTGSSRIQDLTLRGPEENDVTLEVLRTATVTLSGVIVQRRALRFAGRLVGDDLWLHETGMVSPSRNLWGVEGGTAVISRAIVENDGEESMVAESPGTRLELSEIVVTSRGAGALLAALGGFASVRQGLFLGANLLALTDAVIELDDVQMLAGPIATAHRAIVADLDSRVTARHVLIFRPAPTGIVLTNRSRVTFEDGRIEGTEQGGADAAAYLAEEGTLTLSRTVILRPGRVGVLVESAGSRAILTDVVIRDQRPVADISVFGVAVELGAVEMSRVAVLRAIGFGVKLRTATATIADLTVDGVVEGVAARPGEGLSIGAYTTASVRRARISGAVGRALSADFHASAVIADIELADNQGRGLTVDQTSDVEGRDVVVRDVLPGPRDRGIGAAIGFASSLRLTNVTIAGATATALELQATSDAAIQAPAAHLTDATLSGSRVGVASFLTPERRNNLRLERVRLIGNVIDFEPEL